MRTCFVLLVCLGLMMAHVGRLLVGGAVCERHHSALKMDVVPVVHGPLPGPATAVGVGLARFPHSEWVKRVEGATYGVALVWGEVWYCPRCRGEPIRSLFRFHCARDPATAVGEGGGENLAGVVVRWSWSGTLKSQLTVGL